MANGACSYVISVLVADRVGILKEITTALAAMGADITGISQTVVQGYFTVILVARFEAEQRLDAIRSAISNRFPDSEASVLVREFDPSARKPVAGERYVLTMSGREQPGILKTVTSFLAEKGINVEDLYFRIDGERVTHVGEVTVPKPLDIKQLQDELRALLEPMGLGGSLQHENIFRVTHEVDAVRAMIKESSRASD